jgi:hypothetical protein
VLSPDRGRLLSCAKQGRDEGNTNDNQNGPKADHALATSPRYEYVEWALAELFHTSFLDLWGPVFDLETAAYDQATPTEAAAAAGTEALPRLARALEEAFEHHHSRSKERDAEQPVHQYHYSSKYAEVTYLRKR